MIRRILILGLVVLAGCSEAAPTVEPPSTILLPADPDPSPSAMFIGELAGSAINEGNTWSARASVTVLDGDREPVANAVISGEWSEGDTETAACTTDEIGTCEIESDSLRKRVSHAVFEITNLEHARLTYLPEPDQLEDPDDQPRVITIHKP